MTINEILVAARNRYNAYGSSFWGDDELRQLLYEACNVLAVETECIEKTFSTNTVIGTAEYDLPTRTIGIKRATWKGIPLLPISFSEDDLVTGFDESVTDQGDPTYFIQWENKIRLRPTPGSVQSLKVYAYNEPQQLTSVSILEIPSRYHIYTIDYLLSYMIMKDENFSVSGKMMEKWETNVEKARRAIKKLKRATGFARVKSIDDISYQKWI